MEDVYLEYGVLGGYVTSGYAQGKSAASLASRILEGESPLLIELVQDSPNEYMFNYPQLEKLGIDISKLPPQSIILDRPKPLYEEYKYELLSLFAFLVFQTLIIAVLTDNIIRRKKAELALQLSKDNLEIQVLERTEELSLRNDELRKAFDEIKTLRGIIPICSHCKNIRDDKGAWLQLETYISEHSEALFSHGICEKCLAKHFPEVDFESSNE
jgi:hypothetical protein